MEESIDITRYSQGMVVCSHVYGEVVGLFELTSQYLSFERSMENLRSVMGQGGYREPKQLLVIVTREEHTTVSVFMWYKSNCKEMFYYLFLDNVERGRHCIYAVLLHIHVT